MHHANHFLKTYLAKGQRPVLRSLTLSEVSPEKLKTWFKLLRGVDLETFTCIRHGEQSFQVLEEILENFPKVRRLSVTLPGDETWEKDSDEIEEDEFDIDPDVVDLLSNFPNLQHLTLTVELSYDHISGLDVDLEEAAPELGQPVVGSLARWCLLLRNVQLIFKWEDMDVCAVSPIIVQYEIHRRRHEVSAEVVPPRLLDGTIFEFLQTR
ncbi:hypothetical protein B0H11DRAFT_620877 [Mycena galericulata]|nr:hypothetical protein B0H11DRAFT_620877 [Mycena galericulata]